MEIISESLLIMSFKASLLIVFVLSIKLIFDRILGANGHYLIWFLVIFALAFPVTPQSKMSIYNFFDPFGNAVKHQAYQANSNFGDENSKSSVDLIKSGKESFSGPLESDIKVKSGDKKMVFSSYHNNFNELLSGTLDFKFISKLLSFFWLPVVLVLILFNSVKIYLFKKKINSDAESSDREIIDLLDDCKNKLSIHREVKLIVTDTITTPSIIGIKRNRILLPKQILKNFDNEKIELILLHELSHLKRGDLVVNWIISIFQLLYWFNPIVFWGLRKMKDDMEVACDSHVLRNIHKNKHVLYGKTIIDLLEYFSTPTFQPVTANILSNKAQIKRRITMIKKYKKSPLLLTMVSILLIALVGCGTISSPVAPENDSNNTDVQKTSNEAALTDKKGFITFDDSNRIFKDKEIILSDDAFDVSSQIGTPYLLTYYVNKEDLSDTLEYASIPKEYIFPIRSEEESSALYVYTEEGKVSDIRIDEFVGQASNSWKDSDYKINVLGYQMNSQIDDAKLHDEDKELDLLALNEEFKNKSIHDFQDNFSIYNSSSTLSDKNSSYKINIYPLYGKQMPSPFVGLYVYTSEEGIIQNITLGRADLEFDKLPELFDFK